MNKSAIKGFSVRARRKLIEDITQKAYALGVKGTGKYDEIEEFEGGFRVKNAVNQLVYPISVKKDRDKLIAEINRKGFEQVVEEVAYTWFNRIIAIRFMEINEYLPVKVRMLSSEVEDKTEPDVITHIYDYVSDLELDSEKVFNLKENHKDEELFKYIFVKECNNLGKLMPQVFKAIGDYTELLLPDQLLSSGSVVRDLVESIEEDDFKEQVEIIGWMYQYYISEKKDEVFAALKNNKKITKENIPAATQLFTPKWIVKYMTENSLGRLWQESHPDEALKQKWEYYIEPAEQEPEVQKKLDELKNPNLSPEDIKILDPAMGSGHILVYAFDVLYDIYLSRGYAERDIPQLILEKNLFGLDIDDRAAQLATFALLMKGRSRDRRFFRKEIKLNLYSIKESDGISKEALNYFSTSIRKNISINSCIDDAHYLIKVFKNAKDYGSILSIEEVKFDELESIIDDIKASHIEDILEFGYINELVEIFPNLIKQGRLMSEKYDVVIANPPYMGRKGMNNNLVDYVDLQYKDSKSDLFAIFIEKGFDLCKAAGFNAMVTMQSWMFLSSYKNMRSRIVYDYTITNLVHMGNMVMGIAFGTCATVFRKYSDRKYKGSYTRVEISDVDKVLNTVSKLPVEGQFLIRKSSEDFLLIPDSPIAYWITEKLSKVFMNNKSISDYSKPCKGIDTGDNSRFLRYWHEIDINDIGKGFESEEEAMNSCFKYYPYNKGGSYRKWYGNNEYVLYWNGNGAELKNFKKSNLRNKDYYRKDSVTWSTVTSGNFSARYSGFGAYFDNGGSSLFSKYNKRLLAILNSSIFNCFEKLSPTINYQPGDIGKIPCINPENMEEFEPLVNRCIEISKEDWDSFEVSWDYKKHIFISNNLSDELISKKMEEWRHTSKQRFDELKEIETEINRKLIEKYNLHDEVESNVSDSTVSIRTANEIDEIINFISYSVGCMLGRFNHTHDGIQYAGGSFDIDKYPVLVTSKDNLLLISEEDYIENDIVHRFVEFIKITFGVSTLSDNIKYLASVLRPNTNTSPLQVIRDYFVNDFYKEHCKVYKNRPIYWMIDSGKENGIKALFYMHRYDKSTIARFRTDYLHEIQRYYENDIELTEKSNDKKKVDNLKKKLQEVTEFDKVVAHIAHQQIEFDLDDGVDHNYELFQGIEIPQGDGQKPIKADLLAKRK